MVRAHRLWTSGVLIACFMCAQWNGTLAASQEDDVSSASSAVPVDLHADASATYRSVVPANGPILQSALKHVPVESPAFAQRGGYRDRTDRRGGGNGGAQAALVLGAVAAITGTALLVYANRPECRANETAGGCGYGAKVVGASVLSAGIFGFAIGAITWR